MESATADRLWTVGKAEWVIGGLYEPDGIFEKVFHGSGWLDVDEVFGIVEFDFSQRRFWEIEKSKNGKIYK